MIAAFVALGSNLNEPAEQIDRALEFLARIPHTELVAVSSYYQSAPLGGIEQPDFVNAVAELSTTLDASELLRRLLEIERTQGRVRGKRWGPRVIDLDLLVHGNTVSDEKWLQLPHPRIAERNFVLLPLRELAPDLEIPGIGRVAEIAVNESEPKIIRLE